MEFRKLINFGKSSYIVSLPKAWVTKNKLNKGDLVYLDEKPDKIILYPREKSDRDETRQITIDISDKNMKWIKRNIIPAYIKNFNKIIIKGKDLETKSREIKDIIHNVMALEVLEETADKIVAKDFINMKDISIKDLIRRMDIITRAMIQECSDAFEVDKRQIIHERDEDVNRLSFLVYRAVRYLLEHPNQASNQNYKPYDLMNVQTVASFIEKIADDCKRVVKLYNRLKLSKKDIEELRRLHLRMASTYKDAMKAYYTNDTEFALKISENREVLVMDCTNFHKAHLRVEWIGTTIEKLKDMVFCCHYIARTVYS